MTTPLKQVAALPIVDTNKGPLVLLITTRGRGLWTIPKGWPESGVADEKQAALEALEEAGVEGDIGARPIGTFGYTKRFHLYSWAKCQVYIYPLQVRSQLLEWPEKSARKTLWTSPDAASRLVAEAELAALLQALFCKEAA